MTTRPIPAQHYTWALHAVTTHMVDHDLPPFTELCTRAGRLEVVLFERPYDAWLQSLGDDSLVETIGDLLPSGATRVHTDARLPDQGVVVRLVSSREVQPVIGRHRRLEAVTA